jgi:hypothetical protein
MPVSPSGHSTRWWTIRSATVLASCALTAVIGGGPAAADHREYTIVPGHTYTLGEANDPLCAGQISTTIRTPHHRPGTSLVSMSWFPYFTSPCSAVALVNWHNLDTHERGTTPTRMTTTGRGPLPPPITDGNYLEIDTGPGRVVVTVTTTSLHHLAAPPVEVTVAN